MFPEGQTCCGQPAFPDGLPSAFALASGPSKSADIDAEVTYGVHGPLAVIAVLV